MKKLLPYLLTGVLLAPAAFSAADFEGKVSFKMTPARGPQMDMTYNIKGDKLRVEVQTPAGPMGMIMDTTKKEIITLVDQQHMYMVMAMPDVGANSDAQKAGDVPTFEKTGETEKILGYTAQKYISTYRDSKTDLWLAEGIGTFKGLGGGGPMGGRRGGASATSGWERALAGKDLFPLRVVSHNTVNEETFRMEATAIDKQTLPDSLFMPPADYQKFDMGMMGGMRGGMPGGGRPPGGG